MKKILLILFFVSFSIFSQKIDLGKPIATVKYLKTKSIYPDEVKKKLALISMTFGKKLNLEETKAVVDSLINEELFSQELDKLGIKIEEQELAKQLERQKLQMLQGQQMSDEDFKKLLKEKTGSSYEDFKNNMRLSLLQQKLIDTKFPNLMTSLKKPSNSEVEDFYNSNVNYFLSPLMTRYEQIFFQTQGKSTAEKKVAKDRIDGFYKNIKTGGKVAFDKYVTESLNDQSYKAGDAGLIPINAESEAQMTQALGNSFIDVIKNQKIGTFSNVIETKIGYHIIYITDKVKPKLLSLDDTTPGGNGKVRDYIQNVLTQQNQQKLFFSKIESFVKEIRAKSEIAINEDIVKQLL